MTDHFADRLLVAVKAKGAPAAVALDPTPERFPEELRPEVGAGAAAVVEAVATFSRTVLELIAPHVPVVKINSAFFERFHAVGIRAYDALTAEARARGLLVIGDVKRGDVGHTAGMYADAHLGDVEEGDGAGAGPDAITVNGYFGLDGVRPFIEAAAPRGKGVFVLVRTSNPSAAAIQDLAVAELADEKGGSHRPIASTERAIKVHEVVARHVAEWAAAPSLVGSGGYSLVGAVAATRNAADAARLRAAMPKCILLVPGYGAQGGRAEDFAPYFRAGGRGALVAAGRSVLYAYEDAVWTERCGGDWKKCIEESCRRFAGEMGRFTG